MKQFAGLIVFLFVWSSCTLSPIDKVQQTIETQAKLLVDSGYIEKKYIVFEDYFFNDLYRIYLIGDTECTLDNSLGCPSRIVSYKDKFLCFSNHDEPEMLFDEVKKITFYSGNPLNDCFNSIKWVMVVSNRGKMEKLFNYKQLEETATVLNWTELWPYFSGYEAHCPVQMAFNSYNVKIDLKNPRPYNIDSLNLRRGVLENMIGINGKMYLKNNTDSIVMLSSDTKKHCAIVNGIDTLYLSLCDSLPIVLKPYEYRYCSFQSIPDECFFKKLVLERSPWDHLHCLFSDFAYNLMDVNQHKGITRVMHVNTGWLDICDENDLNLFYVLDSDMKRDCNPFYKSRYWEKQFKED